MPFTRTDLSSIVFTTPPDWTGLPAADGPPRKAAVQILIAGQDGALEVLLTRRSDQLRLHAGQVSFPGGKPEPDDLNPAVTAARECEEEVGLDRRLLRPFGYLEPVLTSTNYLVDQAIAVIDDDPRLLEARLRPDPAEVDKAWFTPLAPLLDLEAYQRDERISADGRLRRFWQLPGTDPMIWGATAQMLRNLAVSLQAADA